MSTKAKVRFKEDASVPFFWSNKFKIVQFSTFDMILKAIEELRGHLAKLRTCMVLQIAIIFSATNWFIFS